MSTAWTTDIDELIGRVGDALERTMPRKAYARAQQERLLAFLRDDRRRRQYRTITRIYINLRLDAQGGVGVVLSESTRELLTELLAAYTKELEEG